MRCAPLVAEPRDGGDAVPAVPRVEVLGLPPERRQSSGVTAFLPTMLLTGGVPDAQWLTASDLVEQAAGEHGFGAAKVVVDAPAEHEIVLRGERGSLLRFGTLANATVAIETGCHLPEAAR